ncbi:MAG: hypothetical protein COT17_07150 [Elusimicrobia bacterium CG08_land_8_20_14_0_20_51_18]|nr:MAG: hypothetical protein COT17_07150 [Elusimicrobia bacterium CG08_land_8_20_14_0_20_51_18]
MSVSPYIYAGYYCNNNCVFCSEADEYLERLENKSFAEIKKEILRVRKEFDFVNFMGREPTLRKDLFDILKFAEKCGFRQVGVTTNGRMLAYPDFAAELLATGVKQIGISLSGASASTHDRQTRVPGSFEQTVKGIYNVLKLKKKGVSLLVNLNVNRGNYRELKKMIELPVRLGVKEIDVLYISPLSKRSRTRKVAMSLPELGKYVFRTVRPYLKRPELNLLLVEFPPCALPRAARDYFFPCLEKNSNKTRIPLCAECLYAARCDGILRDYLKLYGTKGFSL